MEAFSVYAPGMLARLNPALLPAIEAEWRAHFADGLVALRRTPSGGVRKFCDAIRVEPDLMSLEHLVRLASGHATQAERDEVADLLLRQHGADTIAVHALRGGIAFQLAAGADPATVRRLKATLEELGDVETPKAPALRQALFPLLAARYGAKPAKVLGAEFRMPLGQAGGAALSLWLDFGGMARGIRWAVEVGVPDARGMPPSASYEGLLGIAVNGWDILRTDLVEPDIALLVARVERTVAMLGGVRWG